MKIAIYGPAGAGKSTTARIMAADFGYELIEADAEVKKLYDDPPSKFRDQLRMIYDGFVNRDGTVDKESIVSAVLYQPDKRIMLEDLLFYDYLLPRIQNDKDQIIDGILPRFINRYPFDQIIYITAPEFIRRKNLMKRGVTTDRIYEIINLQKTFSKESEMFGWLKNLFVKPFVPVQTAPQLTKRLDTPVVRTQITEEVKRAKRKVDECASMYPPLIIPTDVYDSSSHHHHHHDTSSYSSYDSGSSFDCGSSFDSGSCGGCDCGGGGCD